MFPFAAIYLLNTALNVIPCKTKSRNGLCELCELQTGTYNPSSTQELPICIPQADPMNLLCMELLNSRAFIYSQDYIRNLYMNAADTSGCQ